ncbi:MAG: ornithine carbamoyltransferase [Candidatus ainarchaeum sp.]|nr:ornithine carbamoyltransferase [Candidatus ainarchaeum sp.]
MKHFLSMNDLDKEDMEKIFEMADKLGTESFFPKPKCAGLLFDRPSTRTRVSFEVALRELGLHPIYLDYVFSQLTRGEKIEDTGKVLSSYVSIIIARLHKHEMLNRLAASSSVPVINGATDLEHPCQALGDLYTLRQKGLLKNGTKIAYLGNPSTNVANAFLLGAEKFALDLFFIAPRGYSPNPAYAKKAKVLNSFEAKADVAYVNSFDTGEDDLNMFLPFQLDSEKMKKLGAKYSMHPLPAFRGIEVSDEVLDSPNSLAWEQAKNKVAVQKALMQYLLE